jgi:hypothetical protein
MKTKNNNEEIERKLTEDFLPSDGASCSESSYQAWGNDKPIGVEYSITDYRSMTWLVDEMKDLGCEEEAQKAWTKTLSELTPVQLLPWILKSLDPLPFSLVSE